MKSNYFILLFLLITISTTGGIYGQVRVVEKAEREIYRSGKNTAYEIGSFELKNGQRKIYFRDCNEKENKLSFGEVILQSQQDFDYLYTVITDGFNQKVDLPIKIDLGDSYLFLHYDKVIGATILQIGHAYKNTPYKKMLSTTLSKKDINKLFEK
ncbi:hypothetical protein [Sphingobacterium yanglingense]|uniref:Uncharacterized protein n=1 Tax=Sphingobacterium yanglingense TaxID=1437280 RepID=A0A4R6W855_9SPHI|nr:hypothetical protein [Sphingobacterium yanglingense]TDQ73442.1 hypothetical protein CLV99_4494 [Sphingobacterium yanglingense]